MRRATVYILILVMCLIVGCQETTVETKSSLVAKEYSFALEEEIGHGYEVYDGKYLYSELENGCSRLHLFDLSTGDNEVIYEISQFAIDACNSAVIGNKE